MPVSPVPDRFRAAGAVLLLALPLSLGWHPTPTLGSLAEVLGIACAMALLALAPAPVAIDLRRLLLGAGGILLLLLGRGLLQPALSDPAYAGFWAGPCATLVAAFLVSLYWQQDKQGWLRIIAIAVLATALFNAAVGFLQFWRIATVFDLFGPHLLYWDRGDSTPHGNIAQRNLLASLCLLGIAASLYLHPQRPARAIALEAFLAYMVATTASRTPLAILLAVLLMLLVRQRGWRGIAGTSAGWFLAMAAIAQVLAPFLNSLLTEMLGLARPEFAIERLSPSGLGMRPIYYQLATEIGMQSWTWGLGWKTLPTAMIEQGYMQQLWGRDELPTHAHNILLHLWVENGLPIALLVSLYPIWLLLRKGIQGPQGDFARLSLAVLIVHSWLEFPLWHPALLLLFVALLCVLESGGHAAWQPGASSRALLRGTTAIVAILTIVTTLQFIAVARSWERINQGRIEMAAAGLAQFRLNPVTEPYADWLELNLNRDTPAQRVARLERLAKWIPDGMMLDLLADAYRRAGRTTEALQIEQKRRVVFGSPPARQDLH